MMNNRKVQLEAYASYLRNVHTHAMRRQEVDCIKSIISFFYVYWTENISDPASHAEKLELLTIAINFLKCGFLKYCIDLLLQTVSEKQIESIYDGSVSKALSDQADVANEIIRLFSEDYEEIQSRHYLLCAALQGDSFRYANDN